MPERGYSVRRRLVVGLLLAGGVLVGCTPAATRSPQPARTNQVDLPPSYQFVPATIQIEPGTSVTWTNHDNFTHSVQVQGQSEVNMLRPGKTTQIRFDQPGTYPYVCTLHSQNMRGTVVVSGA
jgi:plastocyanin